MWTEWYWIGSLEAFADMCRLRCQPDTQYESQLVANQIDELMFERFLISWSELLGKSKQGSRRIYNSEDEIYSQAISKSIRPMTDDQRNRAVEIAKNNQIQ